MEMIGKILIGIIALEHLYILYMEMFAWETLGRRTFNGVIPNEVWAINVAYFFLGCIVIAGLYGSLTLSRKIFFTQALPAVIAILVLVIS